MGAREKRSEKIPYTLAGIQPIMEELLADRPVSLRGLEEFIKQKIGAGKRHFARSGFGEPTITRAQLQDFWVYEYERDMKKQDQGRYKY